MTGISISEHWIDSSRGKLFCKQWIPEAKISTARAPIVLFRDSLGCVALWRNFPEQLALATGRAVIAYDRLGFGQSAPYPGTLSPSFIVDEAGEAFSALSKHFAFEAFIAFGHSVGGAMATACAAAFPNACRALVTEAAQAFVEQRTIDGIRAAERDFVGDDQLQRLAKYHGDKAQWVLRAWVDTWLSDGFRDWTLDAELIRVQCPVLSLHGELDEFGSALHPERFAALPKGPAAMKLLSGCGHVPHRQQPQVVLVYVSEFLAGLGLLAVADDCRLHA